MPCSTPRRTAPSSPGRTTSGPSSGPSYVRRQRRATPDRHLQGAQAAPVGRRRRLRRPGVRNPAGGRPAEVGALRRRPGRTRAGSELRLAGRVGVRRYRHRGTRPNRGVCIGPVVYRCRVVHGPRCRWRLRHYAQTGQRAEPLGSAKRLPEIQTTRLRSSCGRWLGGPSCAAGRVQAVIAEAGDASHRGRITASSAGIHRVRPDAVVAGAARRGSPRT